MKTTNFICIIDRSGSMEWGWEETTQAFQEFIEKQRKLEGTANITLAFFDNEYTKVYDNVPLDTVNIKQIFTDFQPRSATALNDAICKTILNYTEKNYKCDGTIVVIVTDGGENASIEYNKQDVDALKDIKEKAGWEFVMMGSSKGQMMDYNIKLNNSIVYDKKSHDTMRQSYSLTTSILSSIRDKINREPTI